MAKVKSGHVRDFERARDIVYLSDEQRAKLDSLTKKRGVRVVGAMSRFAGSRKYPVVDFGTPLGQPYGRIDTAGNVHRLSVLDADILADRKDEVIWLLKQVAVKQVRQRRCRTAGSGGDRSSLAG